MDGLEAHPPSVVEWEDLLVRLEIVPRVVRNALEEAAAEDPAVTDALARLVGVEASVGRWLEAAAGEAPQASPAPSGAEAPVALAHRFASLRARTFAMVQRRGLEVWEWEGGLPDGGRATVYQLLGWLVRHDAAALAALREAVRVGSRPC